MFSRHFLIDSVLAVALLMALIGVGVVERRRPPPVRILEEGEEAEPKGDLLGSHKPRMRDKSIYAERTAENRDELVMKRGGSPISERAVQSGFVWLSRHQAEDGSWSSDCLGSGPGSRCEEAGRPCQDPGGLFPFAQTGFALLAFQGGGYYTFNGTKYSPQVKRGLDWLVARQQQDGSFSVKGRRWGNASMYEHAIATFALGEACAIAKDAEQQPDHKYQEALERAIKFIEDYQDPNGGGWRYSPQSPGDSSVSGWVVLALKSALAAGVKVDQGVVRNCIYFFDSLATKDGHTGYTSRVIASPAMTGVGMIVHHFLRETPNSELVKSASKYLATNVARTGMSHDYYMLYNCTLGMYLAGGENWEKWNGIVRDEVLNLQLHTGCERGSWTPQGRIGSGGRICSTALAILTLEVYYRFKKKE